MDFFGAQAQARRDSRLLGWAYAACLMVVVLVLGALMLSVVRIAYAMGRHGDPFEASLGAWAARHPGTVILTLLLILGFIGGASLVRMMQLRAGGGFVARSLGGVRVERNAQDPRRRMLGNVVEEMAIASGVPRPEVYVLEQEDGINAFAAGRTMLRAARHANRGAAWAVAMGAILTIVGYSGWLMARLLQAWISRRRESLADASAVQFTRNPEGLKQALVRVAAMGERRLAGSGMDEVAHMLFAHRARSLFATHPPLLERLQALDPSINAERLESLKRQAIKAWEAGEVREATPAAARPAHISEQLPLGPMGGGVLPAAVSVPVSAAAMIAATAGDPAPRHLDRAVALRRALPASLRASAEEPEAAQAILLSVVIYADHCGRLGFIRERLGEDIATRVHALSHVSANLAPMQRLPAVLQAITALRALPPADLLHFTKGLRELVRLDGGLTVFEYALDKLVVRALLSLEKPDPPHGRLTLGECEEELGVVFAVLARCGARDDLQARQSYEAGLAPLLPRHRPGYQAIDDWVAPFDAALDRLCRLQAPAKQLLIEALVRTIAHDALLAPSEAELLRAICAVLECPLPPVLPAE
jgi:Zn-dependent protease with chaperone function